MDNLYIETCKDVYEPSDDTFLLEEVIEKYIFKNLEKNNKDLNIADIGCGTGYLLLSLCRVIKNIDGSRITLIAIDIDPNAVRCTRNNIYKSNLCKEYSNIIQCDSTSCLRGKSIDIAIINPPYLPNVEYMDIDPGHMWSGGPTGIEIPIHIVRYVASSLKHGGTIYIVLSNLSNIEKFMDIFKETFRIKVVARKKLFFEELLVYEMKHKNKKQV